MWKSKQTVVCNCPGFARWCVEGFCWRAGFGRVRSLRGQMKVIPRHGENEALERTRTTLTAIDRQPPPVEHGQTNRIEPVTQKSIPVDLLDKGVAAVCEGGGPKKLEN